MSQPYSSAFQLPLASEVSLEVHRDQSSASAKKYLSKQCGMWVRWLILLFNDASVSRTIRVAYGKIVDLTLFRLSNNHGKNRQIDNLAPQNLWTKEDAETHRLFSRVVLIASNRKILWRTMLSTSLR